MTLAQLEKQAEKIREDITKMLVHLGVGHSAVFGYGGANKSNPVELALAGIGIIL